MKLKFLLIGLLSTFACSRSDEVVGVIPYVPVYEEINITNLQYQPLQTQGWMYYDAAGYRGLMLIKDGSAYRAFDRACPYDFQEACGQLMMHSSGFFIEDPDCCGSTFDLFGQPTGGPARSSLQEYSALLQGNILTISN